MAVVLIGFNVKCRCSSSYRVDLEARTYKKYLQLVVTPLFTNFSGGVMLKFRIQCWVILIFRNRYNISNLKPLFSIYLFCRVLCLRGTYEIILTFFGTYMVQNQQNNLLPRPDSTISDQYCSRYRYSDISILLWCFSKPILQITDPIYWFIAQH